MIETHPGQEPQSPRSGAQRFGLACLLLAATLALGAVARHATSASRLPGPSPIHAADASLSLEARLDRSSVLQSSDGLVRVELVLRGREGDVGNAVSVPTDLIVVLDRSGSMAGQPLETAKAAVRELVAGLGAADRFALVSYASGAQVDVPLETASPAARQRWTARLAGLPANGGTHMASGLDRAHELLASASRSGRAPRVIVLSDGHANQGDHSLAGLRARAGRALAAEYVLSSVGIGDGFDENVMSALADAGTGNFYYLHDLERLAGVFSAEFSAARETVARALSVHLAPAEGVRVASAAGYPLHADGQGVRFHPGDLFAGQERRVWLTLHAPTASLGELSLGGLHVEFATPEGTRRRLDLEALPQLACVADDDVFHASFDGDRYRRANLNESVGQLKQSVARKVAEGRQAEAVAEVEAYWASSSAEQLEVLGSVSEDEKREVDALRDAVAAPSAAEPAARNRLGKKLLESGRDAQRAGAKR